MGIEKEAETITTSRLILIALVAGCLIGTLPTTAAPPIGGDQGWYTMNCNVDGASVYFDGVYKGVIQDGILNVPVYTTGTPYKAYSVQKTGYTTATGDISGVPAKGESLDLYATLNPVTTSPSPVIGGDQGWYLVHCNVDGATVMFDSQVKGVISGGTLTVLVYTTGTPYRTYSVSMEGYTTYSATIEQFPAKGQTVDLYATLNPVSPPPPTQIGGNQGWYTVNCNVNGATVMFDNQVMGVISNGVLTVPVYTTGTPYQTFTVSMTGYTPYTGTITQFPAKGQTVDLYATLNPATTSAPTKTPLSPLAAMLALAGVVLFLAGKRD